MRRNLAALAVLFACVLASPGCGSERLPEADFTFISGFEHNDWDPQRMSWSQDIRMAHCLYDTLVRLDFKDMSIHPATAERWDVSDDRLTYTFHLRGDARWSDGRPVVAGDFVAAWRRAMLPDLAADYAQLMFHIDGAQAFFDARSTQLEEFARISAAGSGDPKAKQDAAAAMWTTTLDTFNKTVGLRAVDDRTLEVRLAAPLPYFLELTAFATFMPVPAHVLEKDQKFKPDTGALELDAGYWSDPARLVTNGPYKLAQRNFREGTLLVANDGYYDRAAMKNDSIKEMIVSSAQAALSARDQGQADIYLDVPTGEPVAAELVAQGNPHAISQPMAGTYFYNYNCQPEVNGQKNALADVRVRRALSMAIDRQLIVDRVTRMKQPVARTFTPPGSIAGYEPPVEDGVMLNVEEAKRLLAEAGFPDGQGLAGLSILFNTDGGHQHIAQAVQEMWKQNLGVTVTLEPLESKAFRERLKTQRYTIARASWFGDYPDPTTFLEKMTSTDGNNDTGWANPEFDALVQKSKTITDPAERMRTLADAERILVHDQPMAFLFQYVNLYVYDPQKVQGLEPNAWGRWRFEHVSVAQ